MIPLLVTFVVLGLTVGSFLNVCIDRLPEGQSIVRGASHCPNRRHLLASVDLVPVFSYLWLRGRCRYCRASLPVRVPLVEMATGVLFGFLFWKFVLGVERGIALIYASVLLAISVIDLEHQLILNVVVYPAIPVAIALALLWPDPTLVRAALVLVMGVAAVSLPFLIYRQGIGMGDVKLGGLIGLMVGYPQVLVALLLAVVSSGVIASLLLVFRIRGRKDAIPLGPFMAAGAFVTLLWGQAILGWYPPTL